MRLRSLHGLKWTEHGPDVLPAWVADMDFDPAPAVKQAMTEMIERGDLGYNPALLDSLVPAWLGWLRRRHGLSFPDEEVRAFPGVLHCLEYVMTTCSGPGDGVVVFSPIYYPFRNAITESGRRVVDVALGEGWSFDADRFEAALDDRTRMVLFSQPHNPIGRVFNASDIEAVADVVERHDLVVVSDEVWADLTHAPQVHLPLVMADERLRAHTVTVGSASKAFNMSGLRCAVAHVGPAPVRSALAQLPRHLPGGPSTLSAAAAVAAWTEGEKWLAATTAVLTERRDHLARRLAEAAPEVGFDLPEATYLAWLDLRKTGLGDDPAEPLLRHGGVALSSGPLFGAQGVGCARLNFATTEHILDMILDRLIDAIRNGVPA